MIKNIISTTEKGNKITFTGDETEKVKSVKQVIKAIEIDEIVSKQDVVDFLND